MKSSVNSVLVLPLFLAWSISGHARDVPRPGAEDSRIQTIQFDPNQVVLLRGTLGYQFMLEFEPGERIETVSIGDSLGWQVTPNRKANVLFVKPVSRSTTNLTVLTDLRRYSFELRVVPSNDDAPILYVARMVYPPPAQAVAVQAPKPDPLPVAANSAYIMTGSQKERPLRIFDDGHMTYFEWTPDDPLPAIFAVSDEGTESLVNYVIRGPYVVVDQISPGFALRDGKNVIKIVNRGKIPAVARMAP